MASTTSLRIEQEINTSRYLNCLAEGMRDWIEVKSKTGNLTIAKNKKQILNEIKPSTSTTRDVLNKMSSLGIKKETLFEFSNVFKIKKREI